jgi:F0F1-type ATP synthase beta subunit
MELIRRAVSNSVGLVTNISDFVVDVKFPSGDPLPGQFSVLKHFDRPDLNGLQILKTADESNQAKCLLLDAPSKIDVGSTVIATEKPLCIPTIEVQKR